MEPITKEEIIEKGLKATEILENQDVMSFINTELELIKTCLFNTRPDDEAERTKLYYQHYGVTEFLQSLVAYKAAAIRVLEEIERETNPKEEVEE